MFRLNRISRYIILSLALLALYLTVGSALLIFSLSTQIVVFKPAPVDVSIPVDMEVAEVYTYPRHPLRVDIFAKASGYRGYDALRVKDGRLIGREIYPSQLGVAIRVVGEEEYRTYHMSRVRRDGVPQWREVQLEPVTESPLTRLEFLLPLNAIQDVYLSDEVTVA